MKNRIYFKSIAVIFVLSLLIVSCNENKPKGDEFSWSPDGKKLAMINLESQELLIIDVEDDQIKAITSIDTFSGDKAKIYAPGWSPDGQYLLYSKSRKNALTIFIYSLSQGKSTPIDQIRIRDKEDFNSKAFPAWSPKTNQVMWVVWDDAAGNRLFSCLPDGSDKKLLIKLTGENLFPRWSPDGETIAYSGYQKANSPDNGLWEMNADGTDNRQFFKADEITGFEWAPDGSQIAAVQKIERKQDSGESKIFYQLLLMPAAGGSSTFLAEEKNEISRLDWSPDAKYLAYTLDKEEATELWLLDTASFAKVKVNFADLKAYFGWATHHRLYYTIDYPDAVIDASKQETETREILEGLRGIKRNNLLIANEIRGQQKIDSNIYALTFNNRTAAMAYFKPVEPNFLSPEIYFPVIQFADGKKVYPARTKKEHIASADELYLNQEYAIALKHLSNYWNVDLNSADFKSSFDFDLIVKKMEADDDSSQYETLLAGFKDGTYLKTALTMRKTGRAEKAEWLIEQFNKLAVHLVTTGQNKQNIIDENFWSLVGSYSRYHEFDAGIKDLDSFLAIGDLDSALIVYAYFAQSLLAIENQQYESGLQKIKKTIAYLPENLAELDDYRGLLSLVALNKAAQDDPVIISALRLLVKRFPDNEDINEIYEMLGDFYLKIGDQKKAFEAYQHAVVVAFDDYEIWDKILQFCQ